MGFSNGFTDGVILTSTIEAHEGRDVAVIDLPNAFLNADNNEQTLMLLKGTTRRSSDLQCRYQMVLIPTV